MRMTRNMLAATVLGVTVLTACSVSSRVPAATVKPGAAPSRSAVAQAMFAEHCKSAGEEIHRTVDGIEGVYLLKIRPEHVNFGDQYVLDDPYGHDMFGDGYIDTFLHEFYLLATPPSGMARRSAYHFAEAVDPKDGKRYRYTGRLEEPWQTNKHYSKGYIRFVRDKAPAFGAPPRYGVTFDDISTRADRDYWIAGSSLKVIDTLTGEVLAERIGYMVDPAQGSNAGGRAPWLLAADHACPSFGTPHASVAQLEQTEEFVEKVLKPKMENN